MNEKYLLYIDILGFSNLVKNNSSQVEELYSIIDDLAIHKHPGFQPIVFSDTILVFNQATPTTEADHQYFVTYSCEFAQELLRKLVCKNLFFRAILTYGEFSYGKLKNIERYYGKALVNAYLKEKEILCHGLFIEKQCSLHNIVFKTERYDNSFDFVYLTRLMDSLFRNSGGILPTDPIFFDDCGDGFLLVPEIRYLQDVYHLMNNHKDPAIRTKHISAWHFYRKKYGIMLDYLEKNNFEPECICPSHDWSQELDAFKKVYGCGVGINYEGG